MNGTQIMELSVDFYWNDSSPYWDDIIHVAQQRNEVVGLKSGPSRDLNSNYQRDG